MAVPSHEAKLAGDLIRRYGLNADTLVVEVGSGEGELLKPLKFKGIRVLGIEANVQAMARSWFSGVDTLSAHFGIGIAEYIRLHRGPAKLLVARSVRAGSDEFKRLVAGASRCLTPDGAIAIQSAGINAILEVRPDPPARALPRAA